MTWGEWQWWVMLLLEVVDGAAVRGSGVVTRNKSEKKVWTMEWESGEAGV